MCSGMELTEAKTNKALTQNNQNLNQLRSRATPCDDSPFEHIPWRQTHRLDTLSDVEHIPRAINPLLASPRRHDCCRLDRISELDDRCELRNSCLLLGMGTGQSPEGGRRTAQPQRSLGYPQGCLQNGGAAMVLRFGQSLRVRLAPTLRRASFLLGRLENAPT